MKKLLSFCLAMSMIFGVLPMATFAVETENQPIQEMDIIQQEIDAIFTELNEMAAEEKMAEILAEENKELEEKVVALKAQNDQREQYLESRLESLGVNTIDSDNPDDMAAIEEVMLGNSGPSVLSILDPPNLETFADCYTLQQYNSSVTVDGTSYQYSYIYVTDNKSYSGSPLTRSQKNEKLIGRKNTVLKDLLEYQFSFGLSSYFGAIPYAWAADWTIGTAFTILNSFDDDVEVTYVGNSDIYTMTILSVTQMMYVYVYLPGSGWCLCGTRAPNISYTRTESMVSNVDGRAVSDAKAYPTVNSSTGSAAFTYARACINGGNHIIDYIGSFTVNAYEDSDVRFTPGFAPYPGQLYR